MIATKDRPCLVRDAVASVLAGDTIPREVIVIDQSAVALRPDELASLPRCEVRSLSAPPQGLSAARNLGIDVARNDVVVILDDDMLVAPEWLRALLGAVAPTGPAAVATGRVVAGPAEVARGFSPSLAVGDERRTHRGRIGTDALAGGNMAARKDALRKVGLFDERLGPGSGHPAAEDNDLGHRLLEAGYEITYVPEATATHRAWRSDDAYLIYRWRYGLGKGGFYGKNLSLRDPYILKRMVRDISKRTKRLPRSVLSNGRRAAGDVFYVGGIFAGLGSWMYRERVCRRAG